MANTVYSNKVIISIHALRGEGDEGEEASLRPRFTISIHALRGEGDIFGAVSPLTLMIFQSTPSVGRATNTS